MSSCDYEGCDAEIDASILWETGTMRNYCQKHIQQSRNDFPELIKEVDLL